jgi:hypothetical protein
MLEQLSHKGILTSDTDLRPQLAHFSPFGKTVGFSRFDPLSRRWCQPRGIPLWLPALEGSDICLVPDPTLGLAIAACHRPPHVLVVDDHTDAKLLLRRLLELQAALPIFAAGNVNLASLRKSLAGSNAFAIPPILIDAHWQPNQSPEQLAKIQQEFAERQAATWAWRTGLELEQWSIKLQDPIPSDQMIQRP